MELTGVRFGRLIAQTKTIKGARVAWECICDCGTRTITAQVDLRSGDSTSCGCHKAAVLAVRNTKHGKTNSTTYRKWQGMWSRVRHTDRLKNRAYQGVTVCEQWLDFAAFLADMGDAPLGYSLDRIDNAQGYCKTNCRWVPLAEQARNTRRLRFHNGVYISDAARRAGLCPDVVFDRINKLRWDIDRALTTPLRPQRDRP